MPEEKTTSVTPPVQVEDKSLQEEHTLVFTKQQLIIIYNNFIRDLNTNDPKVYALGIARMILPILDKIEPIVVSLSNKDIKPKNGEVKKVEVK